MASRSAVDAVGAACRGRGGCRLPRAWSGVEHVRDIGVGLDPFADASADPIADDVDESGRHGGAAASVGEQRRGKDTHRTTSSASFVVLRVDAPRTITLRSATRDEFAREVVEEPRRQQIVRKHGAGSAATALFDELLQRHSPTGKEADLDWTLELCGQQPAHLTT